ncbi:MAG: hypothetical protein IBJ09_00290 [Bacteroidia bacterium]|nr:hypothetical protein [Bacteroidia bacterium]
MKIVFFLLLTSISLHAYTQNAFSDDLDFVYTRLKQGSSYKTQKYNREKADAKYLALKALYAGRQPDLFESYFRLYELVDALSDLHNDIYGNTEHFSYTDLQKPEFLEKIRNAPEYNFYPHSTADLDSLETELEKKDRNDHEGIYYYETFFKIGIRNAGKMYEGIILESRIPSWQRGETILYLLPLENKRFRLFMGHLVHKRLFSATDHFVAGEFKSLPWKKKNDSPDFYRAPFPEKKYHFVTLNAQTSYLKLGSFSSANENIREATAFYSRIKDSLQTPNLIVDLRNNSGGGDRTSLQFYKLLKRYKGNMSVLINFGTVSNAEQFTVKLKDRKNVSLLGDNTRGMITYGRNYPEDLASPSGRFRIYFSDMKDNWKKYLPYEGKGISPDIYLRNDRDWIEQALEMQKK